MTDFEIRTTTQQHTAAIKMTRPVAQIGPAMGEAFPKIFHAVTSAGMQPAGQPLARYSDFGEALSHHSAALSPRASHGAEGSSSSWASFFHGGFTEKEIE